jgi:hypothetical protein
MSVIIMKSTERGYGYSALLTGDELRTLYLILGDTGPSELDALLEVEGWNADNVVGDGGYAMYKEVEGALNVDDN